jgi:hypothetical protein
MALSDSMRGAGGWDDAAAVPEAPAAFDEAEDAADVDGEFMVPVSW